MNTQEFERGVKLFNSREYFDAHEVWEDAWRAAPGEEKQFLQGLIQVAVALHHDSRGNREGARSLLARARGNLEPYPDAYAGVDLRAIRAAITECEDALRAAAPLPPFWIALM